MTVSLDLKGKSALVTGASRGIGREIALRLAEAGANVGLVARDGQLLGEVAAHVGAHGVEVAIAPADVLDPASVEGAVAKVLGAFGGRVEVLVNNAGVTEDQLLLRMSPEDWDRVLDTNLKGTFLFTKALARPMMKQREGRIVNVSSVIGIRGNAGQANYAAAKAGIIGFTKSIARELASRGITANVVAPGFIDTAMTAKLADEQRSGILKDVPLGRIGGARDVADAVVFLASPLAAYITGAVLQVDGGLAM